MGEYLFDYMTFHSPSTSFAKPSLGTELKIEAENFGATSTKFEEVYGHPKHKLITDTAFIVAALTGIGFAYFSIKDKETTSTILSEVNVGFSGTAGVGIGNAGIAAAFKAYDIAMVAAGVAGAALGPQGQQALENTAFQTLQTTVLSLLSIPGAGGNASITRTKVDDVMSSIPKVLRVLNSISQFAFYFQQGVDMALTTIKNFGGFQQYALQVNSYCFMNQFVCPKRGATRRGILNANYLYPNMQDFEGYRINNFKRESSVIIRLNADLPPPSTKDRSRETLKSSKACDSRMFTSTASAYYGSLKQKLPAQYGQVDSIKWQDTGSCNIITTPLKKYKSSLVFGGDTYLNRFTFKRHLHYFNQTEFQENNGHEFDYRKYYNIAYARYWINTEAYDLSKLVSFTPELPNDFHNLDGCKATRVAKIKAPFIIKDKFFYLSNNSVIDFFVESEFNLDYRDWEEQPFYRHFDNQTYSDLSTLLRSDYLEYDNRYIYDKSLSKQLTENACFTQSIYYDKNIAAQCFTTYPNRVYWSLPFFKGQIKDSWGFYLPNNYYDFPSSNGGLVTGKPLNRTNIVFLFEESAPYLHMAQDSLELDSGVKVTLGDSGLFGNPPVPIITTDVKYGNCQSKFAVTNTQHGLFYPSLRQGRVFLIQSNGQMKEISLNGMNWWFKANMPYKLTEDYPTFSLLDNTLIGIGYTSAFDNTDEIYYLSKKDYKVKPELKALIRWDDTAKTFRYKRNIGAPEIRINLTDTTYFNDASWTISYSPKTDSWISFHDWHPNAILQEETKFSSILNPVISPSTSWKHNNRCDAFSNFYNTQFPWEVEYVVNSGPNTSVLHSIEYSLEVYRYYNDCVDAQHLLDYNFNEAYIHNTEQVTGLLQLNIQDKNQISQVLKYPIINTNSISIGFSKEEQKYRFNTFWDITNDRGEFTTQFIPPIITSQDGYHTIINPAYVDYNKPPFQRKKIRHNWNKVYLRRTHLPDDIQPKMILKFTNNKQTLSPR